MPSLIAHLDRAEQKRLLDELNYLNIGEYQGFCRAHGIPFRIHVRTPAGKKKSTRDTDRKAIVLERIRRYLKTGKIPAETCFAAEVVLSGERASSFTSRSRIYYGVYDKHDPAFVGVLKDLTEGAFRDGAVARILIREYWTAGRAPSCAEFARAWVRAEAQGLGEHPEAAWLTDRARHQAGPDWKAKRKRIAARVLKILDRISKPGS